MGNAMDTMNQLIICPEGNFAERWTADPNGCTENYVAVAINLFPQKGIVMGLGEDLYDGKGFMVAAIERKKPGHVELTALWPKRRLNYPFDESFQTKTLPMLPYLQVYSDGIITLGDTCIVDEVAPADKEHKAIMKYVLGHVDPVRKELAKRIKQLRNSL